MYFVDRNDVEDRLQYIEKLNDIYQTNQSWTTSMEKLALERLVHGWIEAIVDTGNLLIDGYFMRDPGGYADIIDILEDERVMSKDIAAQIHHLIKQRSLIVRELTQIDHQKLFEDTKQSWGAVQAFPELVRSYMREETSANAFKNNPQQI
ncbi:DUF86 domain-containing protein [Bacillaceae bacterium SIJ1]|uniref:DUF86 domain-containing protein n=1 Tax=Litoribacterium kuwaitense TaxID=1398745 RepID=UPI0013ECA3D3|nr:DUF86 domain-containing protein [Litoribacterium kuwaitense]NGP46169.1 DUF86 domain-containing protein [Litoribacterium kuwaitense]